MQGPKIVTLDIETSPMMAYVWGLFDQNIGLDQIVQEWRIISASWKWLGKDKVHYVDNRSDPMDDSKILDKLWGVMDEADIIIGQNLDKFDIRKINARFILDGYEPPSPYQTVDTYKEAKRVAAFTSNKLAWLSQYLSKVEKDKHSEFPGFSLWKECLKGNRKAWNAMRDYNPIDVMGTEEVYLKLRPWMKSHPNMGLFADSKAPVCPQCGSHHLQRRGVAHTKVATYPRYQCVECGSWSRGRFSDMDTETKRRILR